MGGGSTFDVLMIGIIGSCILIVAFGAGYGLYRHRKASVAQDRIDPNMWSPEGVVARDMAYFPPINTTPDYPPDPVKPSAFSSGASSSGAGPSTSMNNFLNRVPSQGSQS